MTSARFVIPPTCSGLEAAADAASAPAGISVVAEPRRPRGEGVTVAHPAEACCRQKRRAGGGV
eukprot:scaffold16219_cov102-Isochrysis_galbana.AAC.23